jgi:hypothetical protein
LHKSQARLFQRRKSASRRSISASVKPKW